MGLVTRERSEKIEKLLESFNLTSEDHSLVCDYMSADPDSRLPHYESQEKQRKAVINLVKMLKLLQKTKLLSIIDGLSSDFLVMLYKAREDFPSDDLLKELEDEIMSKKHYTAGKANNLLEFTKLNFRQLDVAESILNEANSKMEPIKTILGHHEKSCEALKDNFEKFKADYDKSQVEYETCEEARRSLDRFFRLI